MAGLKISCLVDPKSKICISIHYNRLDKRHLSRNAVKALLAANDEGGTLIINEHKRDWMRNPNGKFAFINSGEFYIFTGASEAYRKKQKAAKLKGF